MNVKQLIDLAKKNSGMSLGAMAEELGVQQSRISEWKSEIRTPDTGEIAYFADKAGIDVARTVMDLQRTVDPRFTEIWERALGNLHAATNQAATPSLAISSKMNRDQTIRTLINVVIESLDTTPEQVQVKTMLSAVLNAFLEVQPTIATAPQSGDAKARGVADQKPRLRKSLRT